MSEHGAPERLLKTFATILKRRESSSARRRLTVAAQDSVDFSSNDFLSLSTSPKLRDAYVKELERASHSHPLGSGGSRLLDGNTAYAEAIEHDLADFYDSPSALLFNSGFDANSGVFSCVPQPGDTIIYDEYIHASVHEGMRLSRAKTKQAFAHNDTASFAGVLKSIKSSNPAIAAGRSNVFIAIESVYSMDGDVAPIKEILEHIRTLLPAGNGHLLVDEAHSSGVYGACGRGIVHELGVQDQVLARLHTFGKALSSGGGMLFSIKLWSIPADRSSRASVPSHNEGLPHQLRQKSDLHYSYGLANFGDDQNSPQHAASRRDFFRESCSS